MKALVALAAAALASGALAASAQGSAAHGTALSIAHVQTGCHTWATGKLRPPALRLTLRLGGVLHIHNQDVDAHKLVQVAGPKARVVPARLMTMNHSAHLTFSKRGVYKFRTVVVEMEGMGMPEVETTGPDHNLLLTIVVR